MILKKLTFLPNGIDILLPSGSRLTEVEYETTERLIPFGCRSGACGACAIEVLEGEDALGEPDEDELDFLDDLGLSGGPYRLACQCRLHGDVTVCLATDDVRLEVPGVDTKGDMMSNRVINAGYGDRTPFLTAVTSAELRAVIDTQLDEQVVEWYANVPEAAHLEGADVDSDYYKRNLIETAWRIRLLRVAEAKALVEIAKRSPEAAQVWANYEQEEMLHDELFIDDLAKIGVSREQFLATEPYLSTKLLVGYFSYLLDHEGPLGVVAYSYLVEYVNVKLEPKKLDALKQSVGEDNIGGQISHSHTDINDDHPGEVWEAVRHLLRSDDDVAAFKRYLREHQSILAQYFEELFLDTLSHTAAQPA